MQVNIQCAPSYALAYCYLEAGETMRAESGAMAAMSDGISVTVDAGPGGVAKGLLRKTLAGESFFMAKYTAQVHGAWIAVAPRYPGDIAILDIEPGRDMMCESGSLLALGHNVESDVKFAGVGNVVMREGATMQRVHGHGTALICTYGGMQRFSLGEGERIVVDTGHLVAFTRGMHMRVGPLSGLVASKFSGEGIVAAFTGPGELYLQSRAEAALESWLMPRREQNRR